MLHQLAVLIAICACAYGLVSFVRDLISDRDERWWFCLMEIIGVVLLAFFMFLLVYSPH